MYSRSLEREHSLGFDKKCSDLDGVVISID